MTGTSPPDRNNLNRIWAQKVFGERGDHDVRSAGFHLCRECPGPTGAEQVPKVFGRSPHRRNNLNGFLGSNVAEQIPKVFGTSPLDRNSLNRFLG